MRKNVLENIEKIIEDRKLPGDVEKVIFTRSISNAAIAISILIFIFTLMLGGNYLSKTISVKLYNISSIIFLTISIIIFEIAYKYDNDTIAVSGIEILFLSIFVLFSPYIFINFNKKFIYFTIAFVTIYYLIKIIRIYHSEKQKYLNDISDIPNIIKKESKDKFAIKEKENRKVKQNKILEKKTPKNNRKNKKTKAEKKIINKEKK